MNKIAMKSLHQQQIFERLRHRFSVPAIQSGFSTRTGAAPVRSFFPETILRSGLHECLGQGPGDWPSVLGFALLAASRAGESTKPIFLIRPQSTLQELGEFYGHGFHVFGLDAAQLITIRAKAEKELLWAAEEIVSSQSARAVIAMLGEKERLYGFAASRRLKLRTESAGGLIFVLRHWSQEGATAAHSRWRIARLSSSSEHKTAGPALLGQRRLSVFLERGQGALFTKWEIDSHAPDSFAMASLLADRAARTGSAPQRAA